MHAIGPISDLMTVDEAAEYIGLSKSWLYRAVGTPAGPPAVKFGRQWRISRSRLEAWLEQQFGTAS